MAHTYENLPITVPHIFDKVVKIVSNNLSSDAGLNIDQVSFKYGTWSDIQSSILSDDKNPDKKNIKYPLVCLIYGIDEFFKSGKHVKINVDLLIVNRCEKTDTLEFKYKNNYPKIIYPIYAELKHVISNSQYFEDYEEFEHTKRDLHHLSNENVKDGYALPDVLDAVLMKECKLTLNPESCLKIAQPSTALALIQADGFRSFEAYAVSQNSIVIKFNNYTLNTNGNYKLSIDENYIIDVLPNVSYDVFFPTSTPDKVFIGTIASSLGAKLMFEIDFAEGTIQTFTNSLHFDSKINLSTQTVTSRCSNVVMSVSRKTPEIINNSQLWFTDEIVKEASYEKGKSKSELFYTAEAVIEPNQYTFKFINNTDNGSELITTNILTIGEGSPIIQKTISNI
jgi:hypothetical protein